MGRRTVTSTETPYIYGNSWPEIPWEHPGIDHNIGPESKRENRNHARKKKLQTTNILQDTILLKKPNT